MITHVYVCSVRFIMAPVVVGDGQGRLSEALSHRDRASGRKSLSDSQSWCLEPVRLTDCQ